jgi:Leucine-rich repeat (LRR) protein
MTDNNLSDVPKEIRNLSSLRKLKLDANNFSQFPEAITHLPSLEYLGLGNNKL